jgi:hypothetical protein
MTEAPRGIPVLVVLPGSAASFNIGCTFSTYAARHNVRVQLPQFQT